MRYKVNIKYDNVGAKKYFIVFDENLSTYIKRKFPNEVFLDTRSTKTAGNGVEIDMFFSSKEVYNQIMADSAVNAKMKEFDTYNAANKINVTITGVEV